MRNEILRWERIRNLRIDNDLTQAQIAEMLNVSQSTYSHYEIGDVNYPVGALMKLAEYYNTSMDYLLGLTDEKTPYPRKK